MNKIKSLFVFLNNRSFVKFESKILDSFKALPSLPNEVSEFIVSFGPYLALISGILSVLALLSLLSIGSVISGFMLIAAFYDLKERKLFGWRLVFWSANVGILTSLLTLNIIGAILRAIISWYILSQIREKYT